MVRYVVQDPAVSPLLHILTREFLLSQVSGTMRAPRKTGGRMKPQGKAELEGARPKPAVCRRLFSEDDPADQGLRDNMFNQITEQISRNLDDACTKYNFDFRSEVPLEGDWTWERIVPEDTGAAQVRAEPPASAETPEVPPEESAETAVQPPSTPADTLRHPTVPQ